MDEEKKENEIIRKRKSSQEQFDEIIQNPSKILNTTTTLPGFDDDIDLNLSLASSSSTTLNDPTPPPIQPPHEPPPALDDNDNNTQRLMLAGGSSSSRRSRRASISESGVGRVRPPYRWATDREAVVHSLDYLVSQGITRITGEVKCKKCDGSYEMEYDLTTKYGELVTFIVNEGVMQHRAPAKWVKPSLPNCQLCGEDNSCKPVIAPEYLNINWLFLLLGQLLGCCTLEQLKYFCKHTHNHRTGAKDRVLFLTYYTLCKQLEPNCPFHF
ncbi:hypothetical protein RND81_14G253900 [Saponaria officinalis]|uniref:DUF7086 domain-containing protein n=1 Tax=Saponaria officinalis TaxID=3572 RepID=A0AAW1H1X3_SAPOF